MTTARKKLGGLALAALVGLAVAGCGSNGPTQVQKESQTWAHNFVCSENANSRECEHPALVNAEEEEYAREHPALVKAREREEETP